MDKLKLAVISYLTGVDRKRAVEVSLNQALLRRDSSTTELSIELNGIDRELLERERYLRALVERNG